jgi:hypothetical protein
MSGKGKGSSGSRSCDCRVADEWSFILAVSVRQMEFDCEDETHAFLKEAGLFHYAGLVRGWNISDFAKMDEEKQDDFVHTIIAQAQTHSLPDEECNTVNMLQLRDRNRWERALKDVRLVVGDASSNKRRCPGPAAACNPADK